MTLVNLTLVAILSISLSIVTCFNYQAQFAKSRLDHNLQNPLANSFFKLPILTKKCYLSMSTVEKFMKNDIRNTPLPGHPNRVEGRLDNGFTYVILPNQNPSERFEAHLEVLSGSVHEFERQQGMAHLLEHVAYMGSPKRQLISGTGSRTNAYTDFHHTVFFAQCPLQTPDQFWKKSMLPMAFDALLDVMTTKVDDDRLEKERAAVLSEMSMVNKMEYRVECQVLSALHSENRISIRFPIGKEDLIRSWTKEDVQLYHQIHYRPDNVILYLIGDVNVPTAIETIKQKFGSLAPAVDSAALMKDSGEFPPVSMKSVSRHFPPVVHAWSSPPQTTSKLIPPALVTAVNPPKEQSVNPLNMPTPRIFQHELLQAFSFHLFAKRPVEPITSMAALRRDVMRRISLSALQIRFNVEQRQHPLFTFVDFNQMNWPREGCAVCSLDLTTDPVNWREAIMVAVMEIRRLGLHGLTESELGRYKQAVLTEAQQFEAQCDQMSSEDILNEVMESQACGHTLMNASQRLTATASVLDTITLTDVNAAAKELCEHLSHPDGVNIKPCATVACAPVVDRNGQPFSVTEEDVLGAISEAMLIELEPPTETMVPSSLVSEVKLAEKTRLTSPAWVPLTGKAAAESEVKLASKLGVVQKKLSNGLKVNMKSLSAESQRASLRMYVPGGRLVEDPAKPGAVPLGARTVQEGGACEGHSREAVELFCIDHMVMVEITSKEDSLVFDFQTVTTPGPGGEVTGLEAVMQVAHIILSEMVWEEDAFARARLGLHEHFDSVVKGLETACQERLAQSIFNNDYRFCTPNHAQLEALEMSDVQNAIENQLDPSRVEISICADAPQELLDILSLTYLGTVPPRSAVLTASEQQFQQRLKNAGNDFPLKPFATSAAVTTANKVIAPVIKGKQIGVYLPDSEERAMGYIAGPCPNKWGVQADGSSISKALLENCSKKDAERRSHPIFPMVALMVLQEVANRRLFSVVREERQLTYDASFVLHGHESVPGGWYQVSVTSSPTQVQEALNACREAIRSLKGTFGIMGDSIQSAKRTLINRQKGESQTNKFWVENLSGVQSEDVPLRTLGSIVDFEPVLNSLTVQDIQRLVEVLAFNEADMTACIGVASPRPPSNMQFTAVEQ